MPITFQAPQPFAPGVDRALGEQQVARQDAASMAQAYGQAASLRQQAAIAEADRFAGNARTGAALGERAQEHADQLQFQRDALAASRQPNARDVFAAQVGEAQQQQHAELTAWAHAQDFTFQDNQALQRQQQAVSEVMRAFNDGQLTPAERDDYLTQLRTGIDPARQRQERARAQMEESHAKAYEEQAARQSKIANANAVIAGQSLPDRTRIVYDPQATQLIADAHPGWSAEQVQAEARRQGAYSQNVQQGVDQYGNIHDHWIAGHGRQGKGAGDKPVTRFGDEHGVFSYKNALPEAKAEAEAAFPVKKVAGADGKVSDANAEPRANYMQEVVSRMKADHGRPVGAGGQGGPGSGQIPAPDDAKPFDEDAQASPKQKAILDLANAQVENIKKLPIPEAAKDDYARAVRVTLGMLREYGRVDAAAMARMSEEDRDALTAAGTTIDRIEKMTFQNKSPHGGPVGGWRDRVKWNPYQGYMADVQAGKAGQ